MRCFTNCRLPTSSGIAAPEVDQNAGTSYWGGSRVGLPIECGIKRDLDGTERLLQRKFGALASASIDTVADFLQWEEKPSQYLPEIFVHLIPKQWGILHQLVIALHSLMKQWCRQWQWFMTINFSVKRVIQFWLIILSKESFLLQKRLYSWSCH